jgi:hypothetical protein
VIGITLNSTLGSFVRGQRGSILHDIAYHGVSAARCANAG